MYSPRDAPNPPLAAARQNTEQLASPPIPAQPAGARGELPPIQSGSSYVRSPGSETSGAQTQLPSIKAQFGDLRDLAAGSAAAVVESDRSGLHHAAFAHSPPGSLSRLPTMPLQHQHHAHHVSPPNSPADTFRHGLISPGGPPGSAFPANHYYIHPHHQLQQNGMHHPSLDYAAGSGDSSANRDHSVVSTPVTSVAYGMAAAAGGTSGPYICQFAGCNAPPFQTQYLLNSHANVHSSERPHYCPVEGCPRSKIGKGFKRKNEMIRHGLVHRSPGYVCPFCPDREHKYPRPDNLQRHVKVHHRDKNKDDPLLREVLSQRLDGPSRGRRRSRNLSG
ncbi:hypothetical protein VTK73DRAFT_5545 [Phialemonium thermophilum]|uniref:C2H2-type domain-containing protein n=1 Tax=Phialemonium thermophilum TaxID=223376 RepID=A0ABR3V1F7_9PEZI